MGLLRNKIYLSDEKQLYIKGSEGGGHFATMTKEQLMAIMDLVVAFEQDQIFQLLLRAAADNEQKRLENNKS